MAEGQGFSGLDGQFPQRQLALFSQGHAQEVGLPHRYATGRENQVDIPQLAQARARGVQVIRQDPGVDHLATQALQPAAEQHTVAVVDLPRPQRLTRLDQFIPGGQHRYANLADHRKLGTPQRGGQTLLDRPQPRARRQDQFTNGGFLPLWTNVLPDDQGFGETDTSIRLDFGVLLHLDAIGTRRHRCAGEDSRAGARRQGNRGLAGKDFLTDHQRLCVPVSHAQGITIHRAIGPRRQIEGRQQIVGQHPALDLRQRQTLALDNP
ncbi:hypothetical protein D3C76_1122010 [compost metagenome]